MSKDKTNVKFYGVNTKILYDTQDECEKAEQKFLEAEEQKQFEAQRKKDERAARAKEVSDAMTLANEEVKEAQELLDKFVEDYGSFHMSYKDTTYLPLSNLFNFRLL